MTDTKRQTRYFQFRFDYDTANALSRLKRNTGLSKSSIIRTLINHAPLREMPPLDYHKLIAEVRAVGNNINQIARVANSAGKIDADAYNENMQKLQEILARIQLAVFNR